MKYIKYRIHGNKIYTCNVGIVTLECVIYLFVRFSHNHEIVVILFNNTNIIIIIVCRGV